MQDLWRRNQTNSNYSLSGIAPGAKAGYRRSFIFFNVLMALFMLCFPTFAAVEGDVDGSAHLDLTDVVLALQICTGYSPNVDTNADINNDGRIGLEEAIHALRAVAELTETKAITYPIVDTGQTACFNDPIMIAPPSPGASYYGQDAQIDGNPPSYTISQDGLTVSDNVTGLFWTKSPDLDSDGDIDADDKLTFTQAQNYANTVLNPQDYGGYNDWRLPSIKELYSLMNFNGEDPMTDDVSGLTPFVDTAYFDFAYGDTAAGERIIDAQFWSNNAYVDYVFGDRSAAFGLNLADGRIKGYPTDGPVVKTCYVYFVRGDSDYGVNNFMDNGDGTITDQATGLMWAQNDSGQGMTWKDALAYAVSQNSANYLGYDDWRLPNAKEMQSILDYTRALGATASAAIDPVFNITAILNEDGQTDYPWFWTGATHIRSDGTGSSGVYICFGRAMGCMNGSWLDVHGAGAQRSDPKGDDFSKYTYTPDGYYFANSPQGDAVRIHNFVRLVRDTD